MPKAFSMPWCRECGRSPSKTRPNAICRRCWRCAPRLSNSVPPTSITCVACWQSTDRSYRGRRRSSAKRWTTASMHLRVMLYSSSSTHLARVSVCRICGGQFRGGGHPVVAWQSGGLPTVESAYTEPRRFLWLDNMVTMELRWIIAGWRAPLRSLRFFIPSTWFWDISLRGIPALCCAEIFRLLYWNQQKVRYRLITFLKN